MTGPAPSRAPGRLRRAAGRLRISRFELTIALALVFAATAPLAFAVYQAGRLTEHALAFGLDPRVVDRLESIPGLYLEIFRSRKQLYAEQARAVARGLPRERSRAARYLAEAVRETPRLRRAAWIAPGGKVIAEAESDTPEAEGEWRDAPARVALPGGGVLECTFAIEARLFAELDEARVVGERSRDFEKLGGEIRSTLLRSFGALLVLAALVAAALGVLIARRTTRRVSELVVATRRLAAGDLAVQVDPGRSSDEVAGLARAFNAMVREVRESRDRIVYLEKISGWQDVARRLAHEIKNPLTPDEARVPAARGSRTAAPRRRTSTPRWARRCGTPREIVRDEIGTLQRLVEEFSAFAKLPEVRAAARRARRVRRGLRPDEPADLREGGGRGGAGGPALPGGARPDPHAPRADEPLRERHRRRAPRPRPRSTSACRAPATGRSSPSPTRGPGSSGTCASGSSTRTSRPRGRGPASASPS